MYSRLQEQDQFTALDHRNPIEDSKQYPHWAWEPLSLRFPKGIENVLHDQELGNAPHGLASDFKASSVELKGQSQLFIQRQTNSASRESEGKRHPRLWKGIVFSLAGCQVVRREAQGPCCRRSLALRGAGPLLTNL